jgi:Predicted ribosomal protein
MRITNAFKDDSRFIIDDNISSEALVIYGIDNKEYENIDIGTKVIFPVNKHGLVYGFMIYGSTGYAIKGYDIVSAGITSLSYHVINTIRRYTQDEDKYKEDDLLQMQMFFLPNMRFGIGSEIAKVTLKSMVTSMLDLQSTYSQHIKVIIKWD